MVTFGIVLACYALAIFIPNIGDAMTIVGATTNPAVSPLSDEPLSNSCCD